MKNEEGLYLQSSSELQRISLWASKITRTHCALSLPPNARSTLEEETKSEEVESKENDSTEVKKETETEKPQPVPKTITENGVAGSSK